MKRYLDIQDSGRQSAGFFQLPVHKDLFELDASMDVEYIFGDYLSDVCAQLMKSNYEVDAEGISF